MLYKNAGFLLPSGSVFPCVHAPLWQSQSVCSESEANRGEQKIFYACVHHTLPSFLTVVYPSGLQLRRKPVFCSRFLQSLALITLITVLFKDPHSVTQDSLGFLDAFVSDISITWKGKKAVEIKAWDHWILRLLCMLWGYQTWSVPACRLMRSILNTCLFRLCWYPSYRLFHQHESTYVSWISKIKPWTLALFHCMWWKQTVLPDLLYLLTASVCFQRILYQETPWSSAGRKYRGKDWTELLWQSYDHQTG